MSAQMTIDIPNDRPFLPFLKGIAVGLAGALLAAFVLGANHTTSQAASIPPSPTPSVALFTGSYVDGVPVYRMPPVEITARRGADLASRAQGELDHHRENVTLGPFDFSRRTDPVSS